MSASKYPRFRCNPLRLIANPTYRASEPIRPPNCLNIGRALRLAGKHLLKLRQRLGLENLHSDKTLHVAPWCVNRIGKVRSKRIIAEKESTQVRYYISSLSMDAEKFAHAVRSHWSVENNLHWTLDMSFREDDSRMRTGYSAENFAMMRRLALSLMKRDTTSKKSLKRRRKICGYDERYLERLLFNPDQFLEECPPA